MKNHQSTIRTILVIIGILVLSAIVKFAVGEILKSDFKDQLRTEIAAVYGTDTAVTENTPDDLEDKINILMATYFAYEILHESGFLQFYENRNISRKTLLAFLEHTNPSMTRKDIENVLSQTKPELAPMIIDNPGMFMLGMPTYLAIAEQLKGLRNPFDFVVPSDEEAYKYANTIQKMGLTYGQLETAMLNWARRQ